MSQESHASDNIALMFIRDESIKDHFLYIDALRELDQLKLKRPDNATKLPRSIFNALQNIIDSSCSTNSTLYQSLYNSILHPSSDFLKDEDPNIHSIRILRQQIEFLKFDLHRNIKGYYSHEMIDWHLDAPNKETHPIQYICHTLRTYDTAISSSYIHVQLILDFLFLMTDTLEWFDILDQEMKPRRQDSYNQSISELEFFCKENKNNIGFEHLYETVINPFLSDMSVYRTAFTDMNTRNSNFWEVVEIYKSRHKSNQLNRIRLFLIDIATFLRQIRSLTLSDHAMTLCQNIAFTMECLCGFYDPIEILFEKTTPILKKYYMQNMGNS